MVGLPGEREKGGDVTARVKGTQTAVKRLQLDIDGLLALQSVISSYWVGTFQVCLARAFDERNFRTILVATLFFIRQGDRLQPVWQPVSENCYPQQWRYFQYFFPNATLSVQRGCQYDRFEAGNKAGGFAEGLQIRKAVKMIDVVEQGWLKAGLKRRVACKWLIRSEVFHATKHTSTQ